MRKLIVLMTGVVASVAWADEARTTVTAGAPQVLRARVDAKQSAVKQFAYVGPDKEHVLPYVVDGENWYTTFYFLNLENAAVSVQCEFVAGDGSAKSLKFDIGEGDVTTTNLPVNAIGTFRTTGEAAKMQVAWAYCTASNRTDRFMVHAVLRSKSGDLTRDINIPLHPDSEIKFSVPYLRAGDAKSNLILINTDLDLTATFRVSIYDTNGVLKGQATQSLKAGEQKITVLNDAFPDITFDFGMVMVEKTDGPDWVTGSMLTIGAGGPLSFQSATATN